MRKIDVTLPNKIIFIFFRFYNSLTLTPILKTMKREKISLFVLVAEIVLISLLHSAKNNIQPGVQNQQLTKKNSTNVTFEVTPALHLTKLR